MRIIDLINWVYKVGNRNLFKGWPLQYVIGWFKKYATDKRLIYVQDKDGFGIGFLGYRLNHETKTIHVAGIFSVKLDGFIEEISKIYERDFKGWKIEYERRGKIYSFNPDLTERLLRKLTT